MIKLILIFVASVVSLAAVAREGRGQHETKVKCAVQSLQDAEKCISEVAELMPTENDANAALVTNKPEAKSLLLEILKAQKLEQDTKLVEKADYIGVVVQNDDEASIYYYVLKNKSKTMPTKVGYSVAVADLIYDLCDEPFAYPVKFRSVQNQLLGMDPADVISGKVWLDDVICDQ